ncbi:uncharacterized protein LOC106668659 isoform X2 [Cimex lectularius]|nr:uncharacterized protein LOC106668659 isoform X2 [Cimex lectularius]XP_024081413.1 uncharacterized protein LOC106668659 isoform X2 [Cimex lectularius]
MQSIGLTVEEIAIIYLALPLTTFLSPPVTGFLVDKFGHYKSVVIFSLVLNGLFHHSLMLIPQQEIPGMVPLAYVLRHPETGKVEVWWSPCPSRECPDDEELNLILDDCYDHCLLRNSSVKPPGLLAGIHHSIAVKPPTFIQPPHGNAWCQPYYNSPHQHDAFVHEKDLQFHFENKKIGTTTQKKKKGMTGNAKNSTMKGKPKNETLPTNITLPKEEIPQNNSQQSALFIIDMHTDLAGASQTLGIDIEPESAEEGTETDFSQHFSEKLLVDNGVNFTALEESDLRCGGFVMATNLTYGTLKELAADCMLQICQFRDGGPEVCPPDYKESGDHVFWIYFVLRFLGTTMLAASVTVMDPIALTMVQEYGGEFGRERLFSTFGMAIFSPLSGVLIDYSSRNLGYTDYSAAFYTYTVLMALSSLAVLLMPVGAKLPNDNLMKDMLKLIKMPHVMMFVVFLFILGNCWGFIESYLFLYLKELGASNYLLGITVSVGTLSSIPFLYGAEKITTKIGHVNIIVIAFFAHAARLTGYSFIYDAWWCFPFEAIESLSVHLMWVAAATYCTVIAPKNLLATLIGILGMAHFSLGRGSGSFCGGLLIEKVGIRQSFKLMGLMSVVAGTIYGILHFFWLHKYTNDKEDAKDHAEVEKLNSERDDLEKDEKEKLSESCERLSLMIRFNHRGSLSSLTDPRSLSRRNSSNAEVSKTLLKSALEINYRNSNPQLRTSTPQLSKLSHKVVNDCGGTPQPGKRNKSPITAGSLPGDEFRVRSNSILEEDECDSGSDGSVCKENKETKETKLEVK